MGKNHPSHSTTTPSLSFRKGLGELRKTEWFKRKKKKDFNNILDTIPHIPPT